MSEEKTAKKHSFELTDKEISAFSRDETKQWTNRIMMRFWEIFHDDKDQYNYWANQLVDLGSTLSGWKTFLKEAVHKLRELLSPNLVTIK